MKYDTTWTSLAEYPTAKWLLEDKFGIYTHWGPYSVPARGPNGTGYPNRMYRDKLVCTRTNTGNDAKPENKYHVRTYGSPAEFGYKDFIPMFTAEKFDADEWADIFKKSGARFAGPVAEHHDGFSMWDSKLTKWNSKNMGPKRDITGELARAMRARSMRFVTPFHHARLWWEYPVQDERFDCSDPQYAGLYGPSHGPEERPNKQYLDVWLGKLKEVVDKYEPDLIWFDFMLNEIKESYRREFLAYYYNKSIEWGKEVVVTYKKVLGRHHLPPNVAVLDLELGKMNEMTEHVWITDSTVDAGGGWSHVTDLGFKSVERLVHNLVDRVSKNGCLLLNVGPRADGSIPEQAQEALTGMGKWLEVNGDAIFGTTPWLTDGEVPTKVEGGGNFNENNEPRLNARDIRYTTKGRAIYAICMGRPGDKFTAGQLALLCEDEIESVRMLGVDQDLGWELVQGYGLTIDVPEQMPCEHAFTFKVQLKK